VSPKFELVTLEIEITGVIAWINFLRWMYGIEMAFWVILRLVGFCTSLSDMDSVKEFPVRAHSRTGVVARSAAKTVFHFHCQECTSWHSFNWPSSFEVWGQASVPPKWPKGEMVGGTFIQCAPRTASARIIFLILYTASLQCRTRVLEPYFYQTGVHLETRPRIALQRQGEMYWMWHRVMGRWGDSQL
jgi:hypothetical protein